jgi:hypothetical protein
LHETKTLKDVKKNQKKIYSKMEYLNTEGSHTKVLIYKSRENPLSKKGRLHIIFI